MWFARSKGEMCVQSIRVGAHRLARSVDHLHPLLLRLEAEGARALARLPPASAR